MWSKILIAAILATVIIVLLVRKIRPSRFREIGWARLGAASALFWCVYAVTLIWLCWDEYYNYFQPSYGRWLSPLAGVTYFFIGSGLRWLALRLPGNPVVNFCLLGGLESLPEHALGVFKFNILEIPILVNITPLEVFAFAVFEYAGYWALVVVFALLIDHLWQRYSAGI